MLAGAEEIAHQHRCAQAHAGDAQDQQIHDLVAGTDRRKAHAAGKAPDHNGIHHIIRKLKEVAQHQRYGKRDQMADDAALCQVCHMIRFHIVSHPVYLFRLPASARIRSRRLDQTGDPRPEAGIREIMNGARACFGHAGYSPAYPSPFICGQSYTA